VIKILKGVAKIIIYVGIPIAVAPQVFGLALGDIGDGVGKIVTGSLSLAGHSAVHHMLGALNPFHRG